jgi:hypothetical protein
MVVRVLVAMMFWLGDSWLGEAASSSGGNNTWEIKCLNLQGENPRSSPSWLCVAMAVEGVVLWVWMFSWVLWCMINEMTVFAHYFLLGGDAFGDNGFLVLSWWCLVCCYTKQLQWNNYVILLFIFCCVHPYCIWALCCCRLSVFSIFAILIYFFYQKKFYTLGYIRSHGHAWSNHHNFH